MEVGWAVARKGSRKTGWEPASVGGFGWGWASETTEGGEAAELWFFFC